jgi:hypothetical protein
MNSELKSARDQAAKEMGNRHAMPVIRSMYPSTSRSQMSGQFAQLYTLGFNHAHELLSSKIAELEAERPTTNTGWPHEKKLHEELTALRKQNETMKILIKDLRDNLHEHYNGCLFCGEDLNKVYDDDGEVKIGHRVKCHAYRADDLLAELEQHAKGEVK